MIKPDAFARVAEKWSALALVALAAGPLRFNALKRRLDGVSQKMLTRTLRQLERDGLVHRKVVDERPLRVEYALLRSGRRLLPILVALKKWAETHLFEIGDANAGFDERAAKPERAASK